MTTKSAALAEMIPIDQHTYLQHRRYWLQGDWSDAMVQSPYRDDNRFSSAQPSIQYEEVSRMSEMYYLPPVQDTDYHSSYMPNVASALQDLAAPWESMYAVHPVSDSALIATPAMGYDSRENLRKSTAGDNINLVMPMEDWDERDGSEPVTAGTKLAEEYLNFPVTATTPGKEYKGGDHDRLREPRGTTIPESDRDGTELSEVYEHGRAEKGDEGNQVEQDEQRLTSRTETPLPGRSKVAPRTTSQYEVGDVNGLRKAVLSISSRFYADMAEILRKTPPNVLCSASGDCGLDEILKMAADVQQAYRPICETPGSTHLTSIPLVTPCSGTSHPVSQLVSTGNSLQGQAEVTVLQLPTPKHMLGPWHAAETAQLRSTVETARAMFDAKLLRKEKRRKDEADDGIDWDWVVEQMVCSRSRHQILCKAVELGLKEPWVRRGAKGKRRRVSEQEPQ